MVVKTGRRDEVSIYCSRAVEKIYRAWNLHDLEALMSHFSDDVTVVTPSGSTVDKEGLRRMAAIEFSAFPDGRFWVDRMVSQDDTVWVESTFTGTHKGAWFRIPATNKTVEYPEVDIYDFDGGEKVKLLKLYFPRLRFLNQLNQNAPNPLQKRNQQCRCFMAKYTGECLWLH